MYNLPYEKGFHVSWDQIHRDSRTLALILKKVIMKRGKFKTIVAITRGGMIPAMIISRELDIRLIDTICIKSYDHQKTLEPEIIKLTNEKLSKLGKKVLIIDDLVDSGRTLKIVKNHYPNAFYATVYAKPEGKKFVDTFINEVSQKTWIFFPWDMALQYVEPFEKEGR